MHSARTRATSTLHRTYPVDNRNVTPSEGTWTQVFLSEPEGGPPDTKAKIEICVQELYWGIKLSGRSAQAGGGGQGGGLWTPGQSHQEP